MVSDIRPAQGFLLFVDQEKVHHLFPTLEMAQEDAEPHIPSGQSFKSSQSEVGFVNGIIDMI